MSWYITEIILKIPSENVLVVLKGPFKKTFMKLLKSSMNVKYNWNKIV